LGLLGRPRRRYFTPNPMDSVRRNAERLEQIAPGQGEIALRVRRGHTAFISPEKMNVLERNGARAGALRHRVEELTRNPPARERRAIQGRRGATRGEFIDPAVGGGGGQLAGISEGKQFKTLHPSFWLVNSRHHI